MKLIPTIKMSRLKNTWIYKLNRCCQIALPQSNSNSQLHAERKSPLPASHMVVDAVSSLSFHPAETSERISSDLNLFFIQLMNLWLFCLLINWISSWANCLHLLPIFSPAVFCIMFFWWVCKFYLNIKNTNLLLLFELKQFVNNIFLSSFPLRRCPIFSINTAFFTLFITLEISFENSLKTKVQIQFPLIDDRFN